MSEYTDLIEILNDNDSSVTNIISRYYEPIKILGKGSFSIVLLAYDQISKSNVAIKVMDKNQMKSGQLEGMRNEAKLLDSLCHPNIVRMKYFKETKNKFYIVMEELQGMTLENYMQKLEPNEIVRITKQILQALSYIHQRDIVHRDLKPENIMISHVNGKVRSTLIDFGLSTNVSYDQGLLNENCGTLLYMAPEILQKRDYNRSIDIWALGIVVYNMLFQGKHPFYKIDDNKSQFLQKMKNVTSIKWVHGTDNKIKHFIQKTMAPLPENRLTADQCLRHPWISGCGDILDPVTLNDLFKDFAVKQQMKIMCKAIIFFIFLKQQSKSIQKQINLHNINNLTQQDEDDDVIEAQLNSISLNESVGSLNSTKKTFLIRPAKIAKSCYQIQKIVQDNNQRYNRGSTKRILVTETDSINTPRKSSSVNMKLLQQQQKKALNSSKQIKLPIINSNKEIKIGVRTLKPPLNKRSTDNLTLIVSNPSPSKNVQRQSFQRQFQYLN